MDANLLISILNDKNAYNLSKLQHRYSLPVVSELCALIRQQLSSDVPLWDKAKKGLIFRNNFTPIASQAYKALLNRHNLDFALKRHCIEDEIFATLSLQNLEVPLDLIRKTLSSKQAPANQEERQILALKQALEFIFEPANIISEDNLYTLYMLAVDPFISPELQLQSNCKYRRTGIIKDSSGFVHETLPYELLPEYMEQLFSYINTEDESNTLLKAVIIHFQVDTLHPYLEGNGIIARLLHIWYLVQQGYSVEATSISMYIYRHAHEFFRTFSLIEENYKILGLLDLTPMLDFFSRYVYNSIGADYSKVPSSELMSILDQVFLENNVTPKEHALFEFVISRYSQCEFSTKMLEKDSGIAAYATIRQFVRKFTNLGLLYATQRGNRMRYSVHFPT